MYAKKSLGQNFLMHARIAERIADVAGVTKNDTVLEIGPGTGMLTRPLLARAKKVIAIETDGVLVRELQETFATEIQQGNLELIHGDIRNYPQFVPTVQDCGYQVVANIPYYLTGEIFRLLLTATHQPTSITLLVQKEVAERIARNKKESLLSLSVKAYGTPKYEFTVPRGAFVPAPKVDSAVLSIRNISRKHFAIPETEKLFFELIHAGFAHKRKLLAGNLKGVGVTLPAPLAKKRAEDLSLLDWLTLIH
jgi:16S rRNA (adenine1518-N6/adenine1519-N6)-dimethyltransferase